MAAGLTVTACMTGAVNNASGPSVLGQQKGEPAVVGQPAPAGTGQLDAVSCPSSNRCWAVGAPAPDAERPPSSTSPAATVIDATVDGGRTWVGQPLGLKSPPALTAISCPAVRTCMAVGLSATATAGIVLTTSDGGESWQEEPTPTGAISIEGVQCSRAAGCTVIAGDGTTFWSAHSADLGRTWQRDGDLPGGLEDPDNLSCVTTVSCLVTGFTTTTAGHGQGSIVRTTDGGATWTTAHMPEGTGLLHDAVCATVSSCMAVGTTSSTVSAVLPARGSLLESDDGGLTWHRSATTQPIDDIYAIECATAQRCVAAGTRWIGKPAIGTGAVARSIDGTAHFTELRAEYIPLALTALACPTALHCIAVGNDTVARIAFPAPPTPTAPAALPARHRTVTPRGRGIR